MKKSLFFIVSIILIQGCTNARISQNLASGAIGCPANQIQITNETATIEGLHNFHAHCSDKEYICSYHQSTGINCTEMAGAGLNNDQDMIGGL